VRDDIYIAHRFFLTQTNYEKEKGNAAIIVFCAPPHDSQCKRLRKADQKHSREMQRFVALSTDASIQLQSIFPNNKNNFHENKGKHSSIICYNDDFHRDHPGNSLSTSIM
jgi:hypothetical protein